MDKGIITYEEYVRQVNLNIELTNDKVELTNKVIDLEQENMKLKDKVEGLQDRIDKTIEYIEKYIGNQNYINSNYTEEYDNYFDVKFEVIDNLLNILKGE